MGDPTCDRVAKVGSSRRRCDSRRPRIGLCTALERARWTVWDREAFLLSRAYVDALQTAGAIALMVPPDAWVADAPRRRAGRPRRAGAGRRRGHRPGLLRRRPPPEDHQHAARPRPRGDRAGAARARARPARPRHLPRDAADQRRARRDAGPAPARRRRPHRPPPRAGLLRQRRPRRAAGAGLARRARLRRAPSRDQVPPSPGGRVAGRGRRRERAGACSTTSSRRSRCPSRAGRWASSGTRRSTRAPASCGRSRPKPPAVPAHVC